MSKVLPTQQLGNRCFRHLPAPAVAQSAALRSALGLALLLGGNACADVTGVAPDPSTRPSAGEAAPGPVGAAGLAYYVSPTGNNNNPGTSAAKPWKTIAKVNGRTFAAGDRILFKGGAVFQGNLSFTAADKGSAISPILVASYGTGRATLSGGAGTALSLYNTAGFTIRNLRMLGSGRTANSGSGSGISIYADLAGGVKLPYLRIDSVESSGFGQYGIVIGSWNGSTGFVDVRVTNSSTHDNALAGVSMYAQLPYIHQNVYFGNLLAYNNTGVAGRVTNSGSGIIMGGVSGGVIERSVAHDNGRLCDASEGPVGIWAYDSDSIIIQHNESYNNRTNGPADGGGFDLDQNVRNSTLQYNYSHGNDGAGFLLAHAPNNSNHSANTVRYNVSENDGRRNSAGAVVIWGRTIGAEIYNNSIYLAPSGAGVPVGIKVFNATIVTQDVQHVHIRDNAVYAAGGLKVLSVSADQLNGAVDLRFEGNDYFGGSSAPVVTWGTSTFSGLATWRKASGQEMLGGLTVGSQVDPGFTSPGGGGTLGNAYLLANLTAYRLKATSALRDKAVDLPATFGINVGPSDFYGGVLPSGIAYDVGAHEWP
ncbi:MAG: right-handed parallel beta-helix repeat-containing protein [Gemmatimonadota bacterium]